MGNRVALWHVRDTVRTQNVLTHQGSSIDDIFLVGYELRTGGMVNLGIQNTVAVYRSRWPNIRWWLTIQCFSATAWKAIFAFVTELMRAAYACRFWSACCRY